MTCWSRPRATLLAFTYIAFEFKTIRPIRARIRSIDFKYLQFFNNGNITAHFKTKFRNLKLITNSRFQLQIWDELLPASYTLNIEQRFPTSTIYFHLHIWCLSRQQFHLTADTWKEINDKGLIGYTYCCYASVKFSGKKWLLGWKFFKNYDVLIEEINRKEV